MRTWFVGIVAILLFFSLTSSSNTVNSTPILSQIRRYPTLLLTSNGKEVAESTKYRIEVSGDYLKAFSIVQQSKAFQQSMRVAKLEHQMVRFSQTKEKIFIMMSPKRESDIRGGETGFVVRRKDFKIIKVEKFQ